MKRLLAVLLIIFALFTVAGCDSTDDTEFSNEVKITAPQEIIDPNSIDFGYNEEKDEYDRWYLQGTDDVTYIYFSYDNVENLDNYVCTYTLVQSGVAKAQASMCLSDNNHLCPPPHSSLYVDIVFKDSFNAYDYASNSWYSRGDIDEYNSYFKGKTYTQEDKLYAITFNSDFTCDKTDPKNSVSGTWEVTSKNTVACTFDNEKTNYKINFNDDFTVKSIESDTETYYNEISEDETVNKYKAY
ncbi:MAG: hypothetical protein Q4A12_06365 [Eubacteriales bacterium]|nr:hypothetical protein [Eubacteriales bacterium]